MRTMTSRLGQLPRIPLLVLAATILIIIGGRAYASLRSGGAAPAAPPVAAPANRIDPGAFDPLTPAGVATSSGDLDRIRADVTFWGDKYRANRRDFVSASRLAGSEIEFARATGDLSAYLAAQAAIDAALAFEPDYGLAREYRGVILVALHHFSDARADATRLLADVPDDPAALATLGDAALELGDVTAAQKAYERLTVVADGAAALVRRSHLAFIEGHADEAVADSHAALAAANDEGILGSGLAWYEYQLGETLISTGDRVGAAAAYAEALKIDPRSHWAHWGLARVAAAEGRVDDAITQLDAAISIVPLPDFVARRADLHAIRGATGDAKREADDRKTVLAIAQLTGDAAGVYDRTLSLYLSNTKIDPPRALDLAQSEIRVRKDVYGYDALAWALMANGQPSDANAAMDQALAFGTRDAKLMYHAGMIAAALGDETTAKSMLSGVLALDPSFDPMGARQARDTLARLP